MKKLLFIIGLLIVSCSAESIEEDSCRCEKETFTFIQETVTGANGLPILVSFRETISTEVVPCQEEQEQVSNGDDTYYKIECE